MTKNIVIATLAVLLAVLGTLALVMGQQRATVEVRVWEDVNDPERNYISARAAGGSWRDLGTVPLDMSGISASGRYRYGDIELAVPVPGAPADPTPTPTATSTPTPSPTVTPTTGPTGRVNDDPTPTPTPTASAISSCPVAVGEVACTLRAEINAAMTCSAADAAYRNNLRHLETWDPGHRVRDFTEESRDIAHGQCQRLCGRNCSWETRP